MADSDAAAVQAHQLAAGSNRLLKAASLFDLDVLAKSCTRHTLARGDVLGRANEVAETAYFIEQGIASIVKSEAGDRRAEICLIGNEGFIGSAIVQADGRWPYETFVQSDHLVAVGVGAADLRRLTDQSPAFRAIISNAMHVQTVQIAENLASAAWQRTSVRLARWLLMFYDRMGSHHLDVTHEFMAMMIGAQRPKVTEALHELEDAGAISSGRGRVVIRNPAMLERLADGTYGCAEQEAERLYSAQHRS